MDDAEFLDWIEGLAVEAQHDKAAPMPGVHLPLSEFNRLDFLASGESWPFVRIGDPALIPHSVAPITVVAQVHQARTRIRAQVTRRLKS